MDAIYKKSTLKFFNWYGKKAPDNVWIGVSVEMKKYLNRIELLKQFPCKVKFISFEPFLTIKFRLALYRIGKALKIDEVFFNIFHK